MHHSPSYSSDYDRVAKAIRYITEQSSSQPTLAEIAAHLNLSPFHFQRLFSRWAGVTPKRFLQILTVEHAKKLLTQSRPLLDVAYDLGLSSGSRLYDHFIQLEAMTPGEYKAKGKGLVIHYGIHTTPFGGAFIATTPKGICRFVFLDHDDTDRQIASLREKWPLAEISQNQNQTMRVVRTMFDSSFKSDKPLSLHVSGTNFQISVWRALLRIPPATLTSYSKIAETIGRPKSSRAVGTAIGSNPVALLIPCHRVIRQNGGLGGYRWGVIRKQAIHVWENTHYENNKA